MASISPFHFHRVFSSHIGEPVLAYIRRLRLEKAAYRLLFLNRSVTEVAALAGYSSSAAFTRAYRQHFGATPKKHVRNVTGSRVHGEVIHAAMPHGPEFRRVPEMTVLGVKRLGGYDRAPWAAWVAMREFLGNSARDPRGFVRIGLPLDWPELTPVARRRYEACVVTEMAPEGEVFRKQVGGGTYAVFQHRGPYQGLQAAHEAIFWTWYPVAGLRLRDAPAFHIYRDAPGNGSAGELHTEICIPVELPGASRQLAHAQAGQLQAEF